MKMARLFALISFALGMATISLAGGMPRFSSDPWSVLTGSNAFAGKAAGDTIQLMGPGGIYQGDLEDANCGVDRLPPGWSSVDVTQPTETHWHVAAPVGFDALGIDGNGMWCGDYFTACGADFAGYGDYWNDVVEWRYTVPDPAGPTNVTVSGKILYQVEPDYDFVYLSYQVNGQLGYLNALTFNGPADFGISAAESFSAGINYLPGDYIDGDQVVISFRFTSDGAYSAEGYCYGGTGAVIIDDVTVAVTNGGATTSTFDDFESGEGNWHPILPQGVGDFAQVWCHLKSGYVDLCSANGTNQIAFIDDGEVVPGTGGSQCVNWCYGPGGYIVTPTGGLSPGTGINNYAQTPVMAWPNADFDGIRIAFNVFAHEDFSVDSPGIFWYVGVRSADTDAGESIEDVPYHAIGYWYGSLGYFRRDHDVTSLMVPGRDQVQARFGCVQYFAGLDGYPAPYFDNINLKVYPFAGPAISARDIDMAQDDFPENGTVDMSAPADLSVRFDAALTTSRPIDMADVPGDSIVCTISAVRAGAVLTGPPVLHWTMKPNHLFDAYRTSVFGTATSGVAAGDSARDATGAVAPGKWAFDLPDTGFFYPGDVIHYSIEATDEVAGDQKTTHLPADLAGYADFNHPLAYDQTFIVRALPSISDLAGTQPKVLFWNDAADRGGDEEWYSALEQQGLFAGYDCDVYSTTGPTSGVGNGLGGRATLHQIAGYETMLYTCGDLFKYTISNGDFASGSDFGDDVGLVSGWLDLPGKAMFLTGDELVNSLSGSGSAAVSLMQDDMGVDLFGIDLRYLIGNQATPAVAALAGNGVIVNQDTWVAYGGCYGFNTFDAVTVRPGAIRLAEFLAPGCVAGQYAYSAATANVLASGSKVVSMPYGFMSIYDDQICGAKAAAPLPARVQILSDILDWFGTVGPGEPSAVPEGRFDVRTYPNPFNPEITVAYSLPRRGHVTVKIFDLRGGLVRTLVDDVEEAGSRKAEWNGTDETGWPVASGVYFTEARFGGEVQVGKITMVK